MQYQDTRWWKEDRDPHEVVDQVVRSIRGRQTYRDEMLLRHARLYGDMPAVGLSASNYSRPTDSGFRKLSLNVIRNMADTVQSDVVQSRPRPMFLTSGGDFDLQVRAERLTKFVEGVFYAVGIDRIAARCVLDALVFGTGVAKVFEEYGRVRVERIFPGELYVDDQEAVYGSPRTVYQVKYLDRAVLAELFPKHRAAIEDAPSPDADFRSVGRDQSTDQVQVTEAYHLASGPDAGDGRHVITIQGETLLDEEWTADSFPFVFLRWTDPLLGFWGVGLAEHLTGIQFEINRLLRDIQAAQYLLGNARVWLPRGAKVTKSQFSNEIGSFVEFDGPQPPIIAPAGAVHPEVYQQLDRLYSRAYEIAGVSQLSASSQKPAGLNSGRALRVYSDVQSKRFLRFGREFEEFHVEIARQIVGVMRRLSSDDKAYEVVYQGKTHVERIEWSEVALEEDTYVLKAFPTSMLPNTPAGRLAALEELFNAKLIDRDTFLRLADFPDFEAERSLITAPRDLIEQRIQHILVERDYLGPESFFNLALCLEISKLAYQRSQLQGVDEDRLDLLRRFIEDTIDLIQRAQAPAAPPPGPPGLPPGPPPPDGADPGMGWKDPVTNVPAPVAA
jgi:hypothetical protein